MTESVKVGLEGMIVEENKDLEVVTEAVIEAVTEAVTFE